MAEKNDEKDKAGAQSPTPAATTGAPQQVVVTGQPLAATAPEPVDPEPAPPGGKFGVRETEFRNGKYVETIRYVNAHGLPFTDDPEMNQKADLRDRTDLKGK